MSRNHWNGNDALGAPNLLGLSQNYLSRQYLHFAEGDVAATPTIDMVSKWRVWPKRLETHSSLTMFRPMWLHSLSKFRLGLLVAMWLAPVTLANGADTDFELAKVCPAGFVLSADGL